MKILLPNICRNDHIANKLCHCCNAKIDFETDEALEEGFLRLRRSDAPTPLRKHLPKRLFELLRYQTTRLGASLFDVVRVGMRYHDAPVGAVLPDPAAYDTFRALLDPLLGERHWGFDADADEQPRAAWGDWRRVGAVDPERRFVQRLVVSASRNLDGFRFTPTMTPGELTKAEERIIATLFRLPGEYKGVYNYIRCMKPAVKRELQSHHCLFDCGDKYDLVANIHRFWSYGRGVFVNDDYNFAVWVNAKDHLRVISQEEGGDLRKAYRRLANVMPYIDCRLRPARHERLGILTVDLDNVGSGLILEADVRLMGMRYAGCRAVIEKVARVYHMEITCIDGDLYRVSSRSRLGFTEFEVVKEFNHGLRELITMASFIETSLPEDGVLAGKKRDDIVHDHSYGDTQRYADKNAEKYYYNQIIHQNNYNKGITTKMPSTNKWHAEQAMYEGTNHENIYHEHYAERYDEIYTTEQTTETQTTTVTTTEVTTTETIYTTEYSEETQELQN